MRCVICGRLPAEECHPKIHWVHDWVGIEFTSQSTRIRTFTYLKAPRREAMATARTILEKEKVGTA